MKRHRHALGTTRTRPTTTLLILLAMAASVYGIFIWRSAFRVEDRLFFTLIDDAMISMRYAQHLAAGNGLVWNVGEPPVQGFTNLGWVLLMALLHALDLPAVGPSLGVMLTSAACLLLNAVVVYRICQVIGVKFEHAPLAAAAIAALYFPLIFWSLRGMEIGLLVVLIGLAALVALRLPQGRSMDPAILGLLLAGAVIVRMDSLLQAAIILAFAATSPSASWGRTLLPAGIMVFSLVGVLAFQETYFGDLLPNTYYQKVAGAALSERLQAGILVFNQYAVRDVAMMTLVSAAAIALYPELRSRTIALLAAMFLVQCLYSIWVGGDYAEPELAAANRFITQGMPALIILFALSMDRILKDVLSARPIAVSGPILSLVLSLGTLLVVSGTPWLDWAIDNAPLLKADIRRAKAGLAIAENTASTASIAVHAAGQIPYYSDRRTIDLLGLNDPVIARGPRSARFYPGHDKWNYDYSIATLRPDLIADSWIRLGEYIKGRSDYRQLANGMYVRVGTTLVNEEELLEDYP